MDQTVFQSWLWKGAAPLASPGQSGNIKGRPPGKTLSGKLRQSIEKDFDLIVGPVIESAKAGDIQAASLLLSRVCPALKPIQEAYKIGLPGETLTEKAAAILDAVADGKMSIADAKALLDGLASISKITEIDELTRRIEALEKN